MTLDTYLNRSDALSLTKLAAAADMSKSRLCQLRKPEEHGKFPVDVALRIESATGGLLSASDLSGLVAEARKSAA